MIKETTREIIMEEPCSKKEALCYSQYTSGHKLDKMIYIEFSKENDVLLKIEIQINLDKAPACLYPDEYISKLSELLDEIPRLKHDEIINLTVYGTTRFVCVSFDKIFLPEDALIKLRILEILRDIISCGYYLPEFLDEIDKHISHSEELYEQTTGYYELLDRFNKRIELLKEIKEGSEVKKIIEKIYHCMLILEEECQEV